MAPAIFRPIAKAVNKAIEMCCVSCPTGSTTDENGIISRFDITVCFCDTPDDRSENPYESGVTITVNGTPWTVDSAQPKAGTDCVTFTGLEPLSYGDVILFNFDYSASTWVSPTEDIVNLVITNYIGAPVQLLNLPSFNAVTGRLDPGDFYNARTTSTTFINSDSYVEGITNNKLIYDGARIVQNLAAATATPATQNITVVSGRKYLVSIGAGSAVGATAVCSNAFTGTLTGDGANRITFNSGTAKTAGSTTLTVTITGAIADLQVEDVTAKSVQDAPGEYESVGVAGSVGYGIYNRANGNTVDANGVVTDTPGAVLAIAPVLRHAPAATNISNKDTEALSVWAGAATVNANTDVAPNGATTADTVTDPGAGWYERYIPSMACAGSTDYAASIFIKKTTSASSFPGISLNVIGGSIADAKATCNTDTGAITPRTGFIPDDYGVEDVGDYWRFWVMHNSTTGTALTFLLYPAVNADASATWTDTVGGSVVAWGGQVEAGSVPTPYIYTNGGGASRTIDQILHPWSESVLSQAQGSIVLKIKIKAGTYTPASDVGLVTIYTALNNILYLNSGDAISAESADGTNTVNSGVVAQSADDELGIYVSWANSTIYPAAGNISVGLKNLTTPSAWSESTGNYDGGYPETASILRLLSGLTCEATIEDFVVYNEYQTPTVLKGIIDA